jgi:hypothetical protein
MVETIKPRPKLTLGQWLVFTIVFAVLVYGLQTFGIINFPSFGTSNSGNSNVDTSVQTSDGSAGSSGTGIKNSPNGEFDCSSIPKIDDMTKPYHSYCLTKVVEADQTIPSVTIDKVDCVEIERVSYYPPYIGYHIEASGTATGPVANGPTLDVFYAYPGTVLSKIGEYGTLSQIGTRGRFDPTAIDWPIINLDPRTQEGKYSIYRRIYQPATTRWTASGSMRVYKGEGTGIMVVELDSSKTTSPNRIIAQATKEIICQ